MTETRNTILGHLHRAYYASMLRYAEERAQSFEEAQDLVMEALLNISPHIVGVQAIARPYYWRATIFNLLRRDARRRKVVEFRSIEADEALAEENSTVPPQYAADEQPIHERVETEELVQAVRDSVLKITPNYRDVVVRHYFANQPVEAIGRATGRPTGTVKSRLARGRQALEKPIIERLQR